MTWKIVYTKPAKRDAKKIAHSGLKQQTEHLIEILGQDPYLTPPPYEKLLGDLSGACSRKILLITDLGDSACSHLKIQIPEGSVAS